MTLPRLSLLPAIKRGRHRQSDASAEVADAALRARRPQVLARCRNMCAGCRYVARNPAHLDVHHLDDDHHNNEEENLVAACHTCHPCQHVGELSSRTDHWAQGLGLRSGLAHIPEIGPADLNLLMRAIGAALLDEQARGDAHAIYDEIMARTEVTRHRLGAWKAADIAAAMAQLSDEQYAHRARVLEQERLVFSAQVLRSVGQEFLRDYPTLPVSAWSSVSTGADNTGQPAR